MTFLFNANFATLKMNAVRTIYAQVRNVVKYNQDVPFAITQLKIFIYGAKDVHMVDTMAICLNGLKAINFVLLVVDINAKND